MARLLKKWLELPEADRILFIKIFCLAGMVRVAILIAPFKWLARYLGRQGFASADEADTSKLAEAQRIGRAIEVVSRHTPWESKCLVQAITGKLLLKNRGIANTLYLGVRKNEKNQLIAHAWLRVGPLIITGGSGMPGFQSVSWFGDGYQ